MLLACVVGTVLGACTDDESSPPRPATPDAPAFTIPPSPTGTPCGSIELMEGADVSEREAIETAFPNLPEEGCYRLDVELMHRGDELIWEVHLEAAKPIRVRAHEIHRCRDGRARR